MSEAKKSESAAYTCPPIERLTGLAAVRKRPPMYIGDVHYGPSPILWSAFSNIVSKLAEQCDNSVWITLHRDGSVRVDLEMAMFTTEPAEGLGITRMEARLTDLYYDPQYFSRDERPMRRGPELAGVGLEVTNALSEWMRVRFEFEGREYAIDFARGVTSKPLRVARAKALGRFRTRIHFMPDMTIFSGTLHYHELAVRLESWACIYPGARFVLEDRRVAEDDGGPLRSAFHFPHGICDYLLKAEVMSEPCYWRKQSPVIHSATNDKVLVELGYWYGSHTSPRIESFVNGYPTIEDGAHVDGFMDGLIRAASERSEDAARVRVQHEVMRGLHAVVVVHTWAPRFWGSTRHKLIDHHRVGELVEQTVYEAAMETGRWG